MDIAIFYNTVRLELGFDKDRANLYVLDSHENEMPLLVTDPNEFGAFV